MAAAFSATFCSSRAALSTARCASLVCPAVWVVSSAPVASAAPPRCASVCCAAPSSGAGFAAFRASVLSAGDTCSSTAASTAACTASGSASGSTGAGGVVSVVLILVSTGTVSSRSPNDPIVARVPPPIRPPAIAASRYSAMASSLSIGRPACARSIICWPTSVKPSVVAPPVARPVVRKNRPFHPALPKPIRGLPTPSNNLSDTPSRVAWPNVAVNASPTSTDAFLPAATSSS